MTVGIVVLTRRAPHVAEQIHGVSESAPGPMRKSASSMPAPGTQARPGRARLGGQPEPSVTNHFIRMTGHRGFTRIVRWPLILSVPKLAAEFSRAEEITIKLVIRGTSIGFADAR